MESSSSLQFNESSNNLEETAADVIKSLSLDLQKMTARARKSTTMHSFSSKHSDDESSDPCSCFEDLERRITGRTSRDRSSSSGRDHMKPIVSTNMSLTLPGSELMDSLKSPLSPSQAGIPPVPKNSTTNQGVSRSKTLNDHQICFDMESSNESAIQSGETNAWFSRDFGTPRKRFDSNGNRKLTVSYDESSGISSCGTLEGFQPTHRATHQFIPRHDDEILLEVGDPIYVEHEAEDLWCTGVNLRTTQRGIFPVAYAFEIDFEEECGPISSLRLSLDDKATFYVTLLGTVEVAHHKGNDVLVHAINKVLNFYQSREEIVVPHSVLLDVSFRGIHIIDKSRKNWFQCPNFDYFYSLQNISFCGAHPKQLRYFGFITKHPLLPRFACHVFLSNSTTQPIVDAIGRAFRRSYDEYMAFAHPTEDIFID